MPVMRQGLSKWITVARLRYLLIAGAAVLLIAIVLAWTIGQWGLRRATKDIPKRLGIDIQQQADGVDYTQSRKGKTLFKIHAARAVQMKSGGKTLLHDVRIELYGEDGQRTDTIAGSEFQYDPGAGLAEAAGEVEISLMRPRVRPAIADAIPVAGGSHPSTPANAAKRPDLAKLPDPGGEIHVKTSGLTFDQKSGVASTAKRVDFALTQGNGSSMGATYDSTNGKLVLDRQVEVHVQRLSGPVTVRASHGEFERGQQICALTDADTVYSGGSARAAQSTIHFREDGSVERLDGSGGVDLMSASGGKLSAPRGTLQFDKANHPKDGLLEGGSTFSLVAATGLARRIEGSAPQTRLIFDSTGQLRTAHLEQGVVLQSEQHVLTGGKGAVVRRNWTSRTADIAFATAATGGHERAGPGSRPESRMEARSIHGYGGVVVDSQTVGEAKDSAPRDAATSRLAADTVVAELASGEVLTSLSGTGHAHFDQKTTAGVRQSSSSDQLDVRFLPASQSAKTQTSSSMGEAAVIESVVQIGHVVLTQSKPAGKGGAGTSESGSSEIVANGDRADYDGKSEVLQLSGSPRLRDGELDVSADRVEISRLTGDATARGNVKASWLQGAKLQSSLPSGLLGGSSGANGNNPVHAVAAVAELHQATSEVIFRAAVGDHASSAGGAQPRLWQGANSIAAPVITLNRLKQTLVAESRGPANAVRSVLLNEASGHSSQKESSHPSVIRLLSADLHYSEGERLAVLHGGTAANVEAESAGADGTATIRAKVVEIHLPPAGVHSEAAGPNAGRDSAAARSAGIDRMIAQGQVSVEWPGRRGTGEKLVYTGENGVYVLTGSAGQPPRVTDEAMGNVTGNTLIFHGRDDSVTVEGDGGKTVTETQSSSRSSIRPQAVGKPKKR